MRLPLGLSSASVIGFVFFVSAAKASDTPTLAPKGSYTVVETAAMVAPPTCRIWADLGPNQDEQTAVTLRMTVSGTSTRSLIDMTEISGTEGQKTVYPFKKRNLRTYVNSAGQPIPAEESGENWVYYLGAVAGPGGGSSCNVVIGSIGTTKPVPPSCTITAPAEVVAIGQTAKITLKIEGEVESLKIDGEAKDKQTTTLEFKAESRKTLVAEVQGPGGASACSTVLNVK